MAFLSGLRTRKHPLDRDLREIHVVIETGKMLRIVTNDLTSPAEVVADLYQARWEVELFFRWIKQTLKRRVPAPFLWRLSVEESVVAGQFLALGDVACGDVKALSAGTIVDASRIRIV